MRGTRAIRPDTAAPDITPPSLTGLVGDLANEQWAVAAVAKRLTRPSYERDPQFDLAAPGVLESLTEGLSPVYGEMIGEAQSLEHAMALRSRALKDQEAKNRLDSMGWSGTALRFAAAMTDPASIAIGVATGGSGWAAKGATALTRFTRAGAIAAAANLPIDAAIVSQDPTLENDTMLLGAGAGFFLGGLGGLVGGKAAVEGEKIATTASNIRRKLIINVPFSPLGPGSTIEARLQKLFPHISPEVSLGVIRSKISEDAALRAERVGLVETPRVAADGEPSDLDRLLTQTEAPKPEFTPRVVPTNNAPDSSIDAILARNQQSDFGRLLTQTDAPDPTFAARTVPATAAPDSSVGAILARSQANQSDLDRLLTQTSAPAPVFPRRTQPLNVIQATTQELADARKAGFESYINDEILREIDRLEADAVTTRATTKEVYVDEAGNVLDNNPRTGRLNLADYQAAMGAASARSFTPEARALESIRRQGEFRELAGLSVAEREEALTIMHRAAGLSDEELPRFVENMMAMDPKQVDDILRGNPYEPLDLPHRDPSLKPPTDDEVAGRAGQILEERPDLTPEIAVMEARKQIDFENASTKPGTGKRATSAAIASPQRDRVASEMAASFGGESASILLVVDAFAQGWAKSTGRNVDEYYAGLRVAKGGTPGSDALFQSDSAPVWYSKLSQVVNEKMGGSMDAAQLKAMLQNNGVKPEEMEWSKIGELSGKVSKQQVMDHLTENAVQVQEKVLGSETKPPRSYFRDQAADTMRDDFSRRGGGLTDDVEKAFDDWRAERISDSDLEDVIGIDPADRVRGHELDWTPGDTNQTKFSNYVLPGGEDYREMLLTLPVNAHKSLVERGFTAIRDADRWTIRAADGTGYGMVPLERANTPQEALKAFASIGAEATGATARGFHNSHFDEPNILAHVRFNSRVDADGKKVLFLEEIQSDWHQAGREKGYAGKPVDTTGWTATKRMDKSPITGKPEFVVSDAAGNQISVERSHNTPEDAIAAVARNQDSWSGKVPDAPFKKTWHELAMKRMIRYASENGYDRVAWTTGAHQAERYDLSKQVTRITWDKKPDGNIYIAAHPVGGSEPIAKTLAPSEAADFVGKEIAEKIVSGGQYGKLEGVDLKVGGEGMKGFYDKILPESTNKLIKRHGGKVGEVRIEGAVDGWAAVDRNGVPMDSRRWDTEAQVRTVLRQGGVGGYEPKLLNAENIPVPGFDITPSMKQEAMSKGMPLFQGNKASFEVTASGQRIIRALTNPDASTLPHEVAHDFMQMLPEMDKNLAERAAKSLGADSHAAMDVSHQEAFARGFEAYLRSGEAPNAALKSTFEKFKDWLTDLYRSIVGTPLEGKMNPELKKVFDEMLTKGDVAAPPKLPPEPPRPAKLATDFRPMNGTDAAAVGPRADLAGTTGKSVTDAVRYVSSVLFFDPILRAGKAAGRALNDAATAWHQRTVEAMLAKSMSAYHLPLKQFLRSQGFDRFGRRAEGEATFSRNVARAVRNDEVFARSVPEVQAAAKAVQDAMAEQLGMLKRHLVRGAGLVAEGKNYLPRIYNAASINRFISAAGKDKVVEFVANAITSGRNDLDLQIEKGLTRRVATAIVDRAIGKKGANFNGAMILDQDTLRTILREDVQGITSEELDQVAFRLLGGKSSQKGVPGSLQHRAVLNESFEDVIEGVGPVHVDDLFVNDIPTLLHHSTRNVSGLSAEATILQEARKYFAANGQDIPLTSWSDLRTALQKAGASDLDLKRLDVGWRHLRGIPHDSLTSSILNDIPALNNLRQGIMAYNYATGQGGFVLAAINEIARIPALFGTQQFFRQIPAMVEMFGRRADGTYNDEFVRQLVGMGIIQDHKYSHQLAARADFTDVLDTRTGRNTDRAIRGLRSISNFASRATGLDKADQIGRLLAVRTMMQSLTDEARNWKRAVDEAVTNGMSRADAESFVRSSENLSAKDLSYLGLNEADTRDVFRALTSDNTIVKIDAGGRFDGFTIDLNSMKDDLSAKLVQAMARAADGAIQIGDISSLPGWLVQSPLARTIFQFRSFGIAAWPRQTLRFAQTLDEKTAWKTALYGTLIPTLTYYGRTQLEASMMEEKQAKKYLDERLTLKNLAAVGVAQNGISSVIPMMADNVAGFTPMGTIFANARYSGLGAYGLTQNPTADLVNTVGRTAGNLLELPFVKGDRFTQNEFNMARKLIPLQNALPLKPFWESLKRQFPENDAGSGGFTYVR